MPFAFPSESAFAFGGILSFTLDAHKRILRKLSQVLADNIKADAKTLELRFNSVEAKLDFHREKWKAVIPDPRSTTP